MYTEWMRCDQGYLCSVCGLEVAAIVDSELYLRYVAGEVPIDVLHVTPERHIRCVPALAQYIVDSQFPPVVCTGPFDKRGLDAEYVREEEERITRAWKRLTQIPTLGLALPEYPLVRAVRFD